MRKAQSPYPVNVAALAAAEAAMRDRAFIARTVRDVRAGKQELERGLARLGIRHFPSAGNFVLAYFGERAKKIVAALDRQGTLVRDRSSDFGGEGYVRITLGTPAQMRRLLRELKSNLYEICHSEGRGARFPRHATRVARKSGALARDEESRRRNGGNLGLV